MKDSLYISKDIPPHEYHTDPLLFPPKSTYDRNLPSAEALPLLGSLLEACRSFVERNVSASDYDGLLLVAPQHFIEQRGSWTEQKVFDEPSLRSWLPTDDHLDLEVLNEVRGRKLESIPNDLRCISDWCKVQRAGDNGIAGVPKHDCARSNDPKAHRSVVGKSLSTLGLHGRLVG